MKFECQSCLLQFDAVSSGGDNTCPRCGSNNVKPSGASASTPASNSGPVSGPAAIAATIAQPMVAPFGARATASSGRAPFDPVGAPQAPPPNPYAPAPQSPYGAAPQPPPNPYGPLPQAAPPNPFEAPPNPFAPPQAAPNPYAAPAPSPYGAAPSPYAPPQGAPMGSAFGQPMGGFGAAPMGMVPVTPYGNSQLDAEQRKATILGVLAILTIWPFAIGSFVQLNASKQAAQMGDFNTAIAKAKSSQMWGWLAIGLTAGLIVLGCLIGLAGA